MSPPERAGLSGKEALFAKLHYRKCTRNVNNNVLGGLFWFFFLFSFNVFVYLELGPFFML